MSKLKKHYKNLGLEEGASQEEIQAAYERLSKELDPKNNDNQDFFVEEYKKVQDAYKALVNSSILATEKGSQINSTKKISKEKRNKEPRKNEKELKSVKNWKGYFVLIFFLLVGFGPTMVVYYYNVLVNSIDFNEVNIIAFHEMDLFNQFFTCFKESFIPGYHKNYFLFIFIYVIILSIFLLFQKKATTPRDSKTLKSENQIQVSSRWKKQYKPNSKEALEKIRKYKVLLDLYVITKEEYTKYVKELRSMLLEDINKPS